MLASAIMSREFSLVFAAIVSTPLAFDLIPKEPMETTLILLQYGISTAGAEAQNLRMICVLSKWSCGSTLGHE